MLPLLHALPPWPSAILAQPTSPCLAFHPQTMQEVVTACLFLDRNHPDARVIVVTGQGNKAFAAGADIKEMAAVGYAEVGAGVFGCRCFAVVGRGREAEGGGACPTAEQ